MEIIKLEEENKNKVVLRTENDGSGKICVLGGIYAINDVSVDIIRSLNANRDISVTLKSIVEQYDISLEELVRDVKNFLKQLVKIHVISEKLCNTYIKEIGSDER